MSLRLRDRLWNVLCDYEDFERNHSVDVVFERAQSVANRLNVYKSHLRQCSTKVESTSTRIIGSEISDNYLKDLPSVKHFNLEHKKVYKKTHIKILGCHKICIQENLRLKYTLSLFVCLSFCFSLSLSQWIYISACVCVCVIKWDRHFVSAYSLLDPFSFQYESFHYRMQEIRKALCVSQVLTTLNWGDLRGSKYWNDKHNVQ